MPKRGLVLGAGGNAASAWETGLIAGMADAGVDIRDADVLVGTSAGARVAVQLASGSPLDHSFARQVDPRSSEVPPDLDWRQWRSDLEKAKRGGDRPAETLQRIGAFALAARIADDSDRRNFVAAELPLQSWPDQRVLIVSVEAETGERHIFDRTSEIGLTDAVTASGPVAGVWPAVGFRGRHYIDGGFYSAENADLAAGCDRVLILALRPGARPLSVVPLDAAVATLEREGSRVEVVHLDDATQAIFAAAGGNVLDPSIRQPTAHAARDQGRRIADNVATLWR